MFKKFAEDKRIIAIYIVVILSLITGVTYALGGASLAINVGTSIIAVDSSVYGDTNFDSTKVDLKPILDSEVESRDGVITEGEETEEVNAIRIDFTVGGASTNEADNIIYDIALADLQVHCDLISQYIKWKLVKTDGNNFYDNTPDDTTDDAAVVQGTFKKGIKDNRLVLTAIQQDLPDYNDNQTGYHSYTFYMWMSDSCQDSSISNCTSAIDQTNMLGKYFSGKIEVELYTEGKKSTQYTGNSEIDNCISQNPLNNRPNLDNDNLIPVYYDENSSYTYTGSDGNEVTVTGVWKKANRTNSDNSWYDYSNKRWANAVIIGDSTREEYYKSSGNGTIIDDQDITAFYVWIPRFKYRVWNITRQGGAESTYAYPAFTNGIDIEFETGTSSTGNVECNYNIKTTESASTLSDTCVYNGTDIITVDSGNANYTDAWYTHPAFTFGNKEIEGFWIGKFETSTDTSSACYTTPSVDNCNNTNQNPKILPDVSSLRYQNVSNQFTTAKKFQSYLSDVNAHMLTNLEWGAVTYLTHSIYGLCNGTICQGVYQNNSSGYYTGRSGGDIAGSTNLNLTNVYGSDITTSTTKYNSSGYYNYKGYKLDYSTGNPTTTKDITKVASTTGNVTGVYDISGGSYEYVMGNMVNSSGAFYPSSSVTSDVTNPWNSSSILDSFYYNAYSYGTNYYDAIAFNRARLGDATAEVLGGTSSSSSSWKVGSGITGSNSDFVANASSWFSRGGYYSNSYSGAFYFYIGTGTNNYNNSFRSSLS